MLNPLDDYRLGSALAGYQFPQKGQNALGYAFTVRLRKSTMVHCHLNYFFADH